MASRDSMEVPCENLQSESMCIWWVDSPTQNLNSKSGVYSPLFANCQRSALVDSALWEFTNEILQSSIHLYDFVTHPFTLHNISKCSIIKSVGFILWVNARWDTFEIRRDTYEIRMRYVWDTNRMRYDAICHAPLQITQCAIMLDCKISALHTISECSIRYVWYTYEIRMKCESCEIRYDLSHVMWVNARLDTYEIRMKYESYEIRYDLSNTPPRDIIRVNAPLLNLHVTYYEWMLDSIRMTYVWDANRMRYDTICHTS